MPANAFSFLDTTDKVIYLSKSDLLKNSHQSSKNINYIFSLSPGYVPH